MNCGAVRLREWELFRAVRVTGCDVIEDINIKKEVAEDLVTW